jgi:D-alanyl-D-alanine carboxypeptidase/D-alanyl-D-alanine-endopeptidase (penicillin-binding protein 4)
VARVQGLAAQLDQLVAPVARFAAVGVCVRSLNRGDELYARNGDEAFTPASNEKLLTAAGALDTLGPEFRFVTRVFTLGLRRGAVLHGDLALQGGGDPTLTTEGLSALADAVAASGIQRVTGHIRGDDSVFDRQRYGLGWSWDDLGSEDGPPISGLTLDENAVTVEVRPADRPGLPPRVRIDPPAAAVELRVRALTTPAGEPTVLAIRRPVGQDSIMISGRLPLGSPPRTARVTVEEPALSAAAVFTALLRARHVQIDGPPVLLGTPGSAVLLCERSSPTLAEIVLRMNKPSNNLYAEMLLKALGLPGWGHSPPSPGTGPLALPSDRGAGTGTGGAGEAVLRRFLDRVGLQGPRPALADASGLSRFNLISPRNVVRLLAAMDRHPARAAFFDSLPIAGVDGTLRRRLIGTPAAGAVRAKTGTLTHVTALSGVATTRDGERLAFSILTNNWPGPLSGPGSPREMEDAIAVALAEFSRTPRER